jgi:hypothetical protein
MQTSDPDDSAPPKRGRGRPPGFVGSVNRDIDYSCATCGRSVGRDNLLSKRVVYLKLTRPQKTIRSRAIKWICQPCAEQETEWNQAPLAGSPGMKGTRLAEQE